MDMQCCGKVLLFIWDYTNVVTQMRGDRSWKVYTPCAIFSAHVWLNIQIDVSVQKEVEYTAPDNIDLQRIWE